MSNMTTVNFPGVNRRALATRPDRAAEIRATALELIACRFVACRSEEYEFTSGTILAWMHTYGHFKESHLQAAQRIIDDLALAVCRSDTRATVGNDVFDALKILLDETLTVEERLLFIDVFTKDYFQPGCRTGSLTEIGRVLSGYQGKAQADSSATARVQALLERISAYYADLDARIA